MALSWMLLFLVSMGPQTLGQSGDDEGGSGPLSGNSLLSGVRTDPVGAASPPLSSQVLQDPCSVRFSTRPTASAQKLLREDMAILHAIQHQNKEMMERLKLFMEAELSDQSYEDVIKENIVGIQDDLKVCSMKVEKAEEDLERELAGETEDSIAVMQKIITKSSAADGLLQAAESVARRLENSWQNLEASFTRTSTQLQR